MTKKKTKVHYNKLVRDKIDKVLDTTGKEYLIEKELDKMQLIQYYKAKLLEEVNELVYAESKREITEEISDLLQVVTDYMILQEIPEADVSSEKVRKIMDRGGFSNKILKYVVNDSVEI